MTNGLGKDYGGVIALADRGRRDRAAAHPLMLGTLGAWYETVVLFGDLPAGAMLLGIPLTSPPSGQAPISRAGERSGRKALSMVVRRE